MRRGGTLSSLVILAAFFGSVAAAFWLVFTLMPDAWRPYAVMLLVFGWLIFFAVSAGRDGLRVPTEMNIPTEKNTAQGLIGMVVFGVFEFAAFWIAARSDTQLTVPLAFVGIVLAGWLLHAAKIL